jgi:hypothetical protein
MGLATADVDRVIQLSVAALLSAILLVVLVLNAWLGWPRADPLAGLDIAVAAREGARAWRGKQCDDCAIPPRAARTARPAAAGQGHRHLPYQRRLEAQAIAIATLSAYAIAGRIVIMGAVITA